MESNSELEQLYDKKFRPLNIEFKKIATNWQMKTTPQGRNVLNDHSDKDYDQRIINSLIEFHKKIKDLSGELIPLFHETEEYLKRLDKAIDMVQNGDHKFITGVTVDSYHTVWYEFHYELLKILGREGQLAEDEV